MHAQDVPFGREQSSFAGSPPFNDEENSAAYQPGFVKRTVTFPGHLKRAEGYQHDPRITKLALVRDLALGCPELSDAAFRQVVTLIILVSPPGWDSGGLMVHIGNGLLGRLQGCSDSALRRSGRELEEAGLVLRHMDEANHPASGRRFDLRPLAARHAEISARIAEIFAAHQRARTERRFCCTAPDPANQPHEPAAGPAPAETSPQGPSDPPGGEVKSDAPIDTDTDPDAHSERVQSQQTEAVDNSSDASPSSRPTGSSPHTKASKSKGHTPPRRGYWRPTDPTPAPRSLTSATALLSTVSPDFAVALQKSARCPEAPSLEDLLEAADRLREFLKVPRSVWIDSHSRLDRLDRVAILVAAMAKPQADFHTGRTAWARSMLSKQKGEIDIWATILKLQSSRARLN